MHVRQLSQLAVLLLVGSCDAQSEASDRARLGTSLPADAACADVAQLRQHATDDRLRMAEVSSQQTRIVVGARANFLASLAVAAQLRCVGTPAAENDALQDALEVARRAEGASSFYEQASRWDEANYALTRVIDDLVQRLPHE
jgi:flavin-binding protein dodecin